MPMIITENLSEPKLGDEFEHKNADAEWWYFDGQTLDGVVLNMIFYSHLGNNKPTFSLFLQRPSDKPIAIHEQMDVTFSSNDDHYILMGPHQATKTDSRVDIVAKGSDYKVDLQFSSVYSPNKLGIVTPGMGWRIEMPKATIHGHISIQGKDIPFNGVGYHDHNWFTNPHITPEMNNREVLAKVLKGWQFGRFFGQSVDLVYGYNSQESHVLLNGIQVRNLIKLLTTEHHHRFRINYDKEIVVETPGGNFLIKNDQIISANALVEKEGAVVDGYLRFLSEATINQEKMRGVHEFWT